MAHDFPNQKFGWILDDDGNWSLYDQNGQKIAGSDNSRLQVPTPVDADDSANKDYVDTHGGGGGSISVTDGSTTVSPATSIDFTSGGTVTDEGGGVAGVSVGGGSMPQYVQPTDPGAVGAGALWFDTALGAINWDELSPGASPTARQGFSLAYDAARGKVVLFGGTNAASETHMDDTWTWDGATWTEENPDTVPPGRVDHQMAYDSVRERVVMFGGQVAADPFYGDDTWEWDGTDWTQIVTDHAPSIRADYGMAYDAARAVCTLFGGYDGSTYDNADTWTYDGTDWTELTPATSPLGRACTRSFAYDGGHEKIVMFGGYGDTGSGDDQLQDTWTWDGTTWTEEAPSHVPGGRTYSFMGYDAARGKVVMFAGQDVDGGPVVLSDTWTWDGTDWTEESPGTSPSGRYDGGFAVDASGQLTLFGGNTNNLGDPSGENDETWQWAASFVLKVRNPADTGWTTVGA